MNDKGNITFLGLCFLLIISLVCLQAIEKKISYIHDQKQKQTLLLCSKEINGIGQSYVKQIFKLNHYLKILTIGKNLSLLIPIPGINLQTNAGVKTAIKTLKLAQIGHTYAFLKSSRRTTKGRCKISSQFYTTPFKFEVTHFKRDSFNQVIMRESTWKYIISSKTALTYNKLYLKTQKVSSTLQEGKYISKLLSSLPLLF